MIGLNVFFAGLLILFSSITVFAEVKTVKSKNAHRYNHPEIVIQFENTAVSENDARVILDGLMSEVSKGVKYKDGETLLLGGMINKFSKIDDKHIQLLEPDMVSMPIKYIPGLTKSLIQLKLQKSVVSSFKGDLDLDHPPIASALHLPSDYKSLKSLVLRRTAAKGRDTGWRMFHSNPKKNKAGHMWISVYELSLHRPELIKFLALPVNSLFLIENGKFIQGNIDGKKMVVKRGSFVSKL